MSAPPSRTSAFRAVWRIAGFTLLTVFTVAAHAALRPFGTGAFWPVVLFWHRAAVRLCGLKVRVSGAPAAGRPVLFAGNHISYLDIPVLASAAGAPFAAKAEISRWPVFGFLAKLGRTVFIDRRAARAGDHLRAVGARLAAGESLFIFPEGTSSDGAGVLPFKSTLFGALYADGAAAPVTAQPVSIAYTHGAGGRPLTGADRALYGWFGDATMAGHLLRVFAMKGALVEVIFHPPVSSADFKGRKEIAGHCGRAAAEGVRRLNAGAEKAAHSPSRHSGSQARP